LIARAQGAFEGALAQIVGVGRVAGQRAGETPQSRQELKKVALESPQNSLRFRE